MAADERPATPDPLEERLRRLLRYGGGAFLLVAIVVLAFADTLGFGHVEPFVFGALTSSFLVIVAPDVIGSRLGKR